LSGAVLGGRFGRAAGPLAFVIAGLWGVASAPDRIGCLHRRSAPNRFADSSICLRFTFHFAERRPARGSGHWFACSAISCLVGMGTKEVMGDWHRSRVLYDRTFLAGGFFPAWRDAEAIICRWPVPGCLLACSCCGGAVPGEQLRALASAFLVTYLLKQSEAILVYLKLSFWPHPLVLDYRRTVVRSVADVWLAGAGRARIAGGHALGP